MIKTLHCDVQNKRITSEVCYENWLLANCGLAVMPRGVAPCRGCARGRRTRRRWYEEGLRFGVLDPAEWRATLARWAKQHPELFNE